MPHYLIIIITILSIITIIHILIRHKKGATDEELLLLNKGLSFIKKIIYFSVIYEILRHYYSHYFFITENHLDGYIVIVLIMFVIYKALKLLNNSTFNC